MSNEPPGIQPAPASETSTTLGRPSRIAFCLAGLCCVGFGIVDLLQELQGHPSLRTESFLKPAGPLLTWLVLLYGVVLIIRASRPGTRRSMPALVIAGVVAITLVAAVTVGRTPRIPDEVIVQQGSYPDLCPGVTIGEMLARGHDRVEWISYFNKYGYRSVQAACFDEGDDPTSVLVWNIDDDQRFVIQFAMQDGTPVDPYGLVAELCRGADAAPETPTER